jgi:bacterioferritin-associated ferredoxin
MIVCSCNVISDHQLRSALAETAQRPRMSRIYGYLGSSVQCGRCAHTIKRIIEQIASRAIGPASAAVEAAGRRQT